MKATTKAITLVLALISGFGGLAFAGAGRKQTTIAATATTDPNSTCTSLMSGDGTPEQFRGYLEYHFILTVTPPAGAPFGLGGSADCGTFMVTNTPSLFNTIQIIIDNSWPGGNLSVLVEMTFPDGSPRAWYTATYATNDHGVYQPPLAPFSLYVPTGTVVHYTFIWGLPDPVHMCPGRCQAIANTFMQGNR